MNTLLPVGSLLLGRAFVEHVDGPVVTWGKKQKHLSARAGWSFMPVSVYLPVLVCGYVCLRTCVCEHPVGAESNTVGQVGGKLFRPQSDCPVVPIGRLLKQQDTVSNVWTTHNNTSCKHTAAWCTFCGAYRMKKKNLIVLCMIPLSSYFRVLDQKWTIKLGQEEAVAIQYARPDYQCWVKVLHYAVY